MRGDAAPLPHCTCSSALRGLQERPSPAPGNPNPWGGTLMPWPHWDGGGALGCTPQQLNQAQAQPSHHSHLAAAFQGTGRGIPLDGSSNSPSVHLSRITTNLPTLPGLLLSKALTVWQGFGEQGAQTKETQLHSTRHIACHPSTYPTSPGQKKSRKKEKANCKDESGPPPDGLELLQLCKSRRRRAARQLCRCFLIAKSFWVIQK